MSAKFEILNQKVSCNSVKNELASHRDTNKRYYRVRINMIEDYKKKYPFDKLTEYIIDGYKIKPDEKYIVYDLPARNLLCARRIDVMAKWIYLEALSSGVDIPFATEVYLSHISAWSGGSFIEAGSEDKKNSKEKYLEGFREIYKNILQNGFDSRVSIIPVGKNLEILDGSHRTSVAAFLDKNITIIQFPRLERRFDSNFFQTCKLEDTYLKAMVSKYYMLVKDTRIMGCLLTYNKRSNRELYLYRNNIQVVYVRNLNDVNIDGKRYNKAIFYEILDKNENNLEDILINTLKILDYKIIDPNLVLGR